jgi:hypothetical protein
MAAFPAPAEGFLLTAAARSLCLRDPRRALIEVGQLVGRPDA